MPRKTLVILSQVFVPDPAAVGQYMTEVAVTMAQRGHRVKVYASARGYDDPSRRYPLREDMHGVDVRRVDLASFGKSSILTRIAGTASFMLQMFFQLLTERNLGAIFFTTSPPLMGFVASVAGKLRRVPIAYWAMDLNPDQLIALGKLKKTSLAARLLERANRFILRRADLVIALDRFMAERLEERMPLAGKLLVLPPWPLEGRLGDSHCLPESVETDANPFRHEHGLIGRVVVMYSGNHSASNPLGTLLQATLAFRDDAVLCFAFVGGGTGKKEVEAFIAEHRLTNVISVPYQPIEQLRYSLAAADVHVATLGQQMVGIIHPCKVYSAMAVSRPILYIGPSPSHISDLITRYNVGWHVEHGDVAGAIEAIRQLREMPLRARLEMGRRARETVTRELGEVKLCSRLCGQLESTFRLSRRK